MQHPLSILFVWVRLALWLSLAMGAWAGCATTGAAQGAVSLARLASRYGLRVDTSDHGRAMLGNDAGTSMALRDDSRKLRVNDVYVWLHDPARLNRRRWTVSEVDAREIIAPLLVDPVVALRSDRPRVVLDPGHGGRDGGAVSLSGYKEKDLALDIAYRTRQRLVDAGIEVRMTRDRDVTVGLRQRTLLTEQWGADLLVSIHLNAAPSRSAQGLETFVLTAAGHPSTGSNVARCHAVHPGHEHALGSIALAYRVHRAMLAETQARDRGVRRARFDVVRHAPCPAILVECGFLTNEDEERRLLQTAYRDALADGLARGIQSYLGLARPTGDRHEPTDEAPDMEAEPALGRLRRFLWFWR